MVGGSLNYPPLGYDDETIMPCTQTRHFLQVLLQKLTIEITDQIIEEIYCILDALLKSTEELQVMHRLFAEQIFQETQGFVRSPSEEGLQKLKQKMLEFSAKFHE